MIGGGLTSGGGMDLTGGAGGGSSALGGTSGSASGGSATGSVDFNIGGNPNVNKALDVLKNPILIGVVGLVAVIYLIKK